MFGLFLLALLFAVIVFWARLFSVFTVRGSFIYAADFPRSYDALPSFDAMFWKPRYWHRWTTNHWRAFLEGEKT